MLEAKQLYFHYGDRKGEPVINGVSLRVEPGERVGLLDPSGSGKTTLLRILGGYLSPSSGSVLVDGSPLPQKGRSPVQLIWQHPERALDPRLRMGRSLEEGGRVEPRITEGLGIEEDWKKRYPGELSGGELQRFCIARALGANTRYLLCDEITTMMDMISQSQIWQFLIRETQERGLGLVVASHSRELLEHVCTRQVELAGLQGKYGRDV